MSTSFTTRNGLTFDCALNLGTVDFIEKSDYSLHTKVPVKLITGLSRELLQELQSNLRLCNAVIYTIAWFTDQLPEEWKSLDESQIQAKWVNEFNGTALLASRKALWRALADFFPELTDGLSAIEDLQQELEKAAVEEMRAAKDEIMSTSRELMQKETRRALQELKGGELSGGRQGT